MAHRARAPTSTARPRSGWSRIDRDTARHEIRDLNVSTALRGDFAAAHLTGDQRQRAADRHAEEHRVRLRPEQRRRADRGVRAAAGPALHADIAGGDRGPGGGRGVRLGPDRRRRRAARPRVRAPRPGGPDHRGDRRRDRPGGAGLGGVRAQGPGRAQVDRLGVPRLPHGPVHDAGRDRRPDPGHPLVARWRYATPAVDWDAAYARAQVGPADARSRTRTAWPCSRPCRPWARRR